MKKEELAKTNDTTQNEMVVLDDQVTILNNCAFIATCYLLPKLPGFIQQILDIPKYMMDKGYGLEIKQKDFALRFGKDLFGMKDDTLEAQRG